MRVRAHPRQVEHPVVGAPPFGGALELDWREQCRPGRPYQLSVFDSSAILLEPTCDEQAEAVPAPTPGKQYRAGWRDWFDPAAYRQFAKAA